VSVPGQRVRIAPGVAPGAGEPSFTQWVDISAYVKEIHVRSGASLDLNRIESSTVTVVLENSDARFTPLNTLGPYANKVIPFMPFDIQWISDGLATPFTLDASHLDSADCTLYGVAPASSRIFRGVVQNWDPNWLTAQGGDLSLTAVDQFRYYQLAQIKARTFPQQTAGQRIAAILSAIGSPFPSVVDSGGMTLQATTYTGNALDFMRAVATLDGGAVYVRADGILIFNCLQSIMASSTWSTPQAVLGDGPGELNYLGAERSGLHLSYDEQQIVNQIDGATADGTPITTVNDATSQTNYLTRPYDFGSTDAVTLSQLQNRAVYEMLSRRSPRLRVDAIAFEMTDPNLATATLIALDLMQRVTLVRRPDKGSTISHDYIVQGFEHDYTIEPYRWEMRVILSSAPDPFWVLGTAALDTGTILV